ISGFVAFWRDRAWSRGLARATVVAVPGAFCAAHAAVHVRLAAPGADPVWREDRKTCSDPPRCARDLPLESDDGRLRLDWRRCDSLLCCGYIDWIAFRYLARSIPLRGNARLPRGFFPVRQRAHQNCGRVLDRCAGFYRTGGRNRTCGCDRCRIDCCDERWGRDDCGGKSGQVGWQTYSRDPGWLTVVPYVEFCESPARRLRGGL